MNRVEYKEFMFKQIGAQLDYAFDLGEELYGRELTLEEKDMELMSIMKASVLRYELALKGYDEESINEIMISMSKESLDHIIDNQEDKITKRRFEIMSESIIEREKDKSDIHKEYLEKQTIFVF